MSSKLVKNGYISNLKTFFMRRILEAALLAFLLAGTYEARASVDGAFDRWQSDKYSMFVHFGLYSHLGGVWEGKPVRRGYSEQIQSFAGIFSDWYAMTANMFDPKGFDADAIASLALDGGMRSVVFTSKHHDGFCMFDTETTSYNSVDMTPSGRDYVREVSDACRKAGLKFGLYFSLIDWNYPHAFPISSHNADFVTPEHHEFNKAQVFELLTDYGPVSELWFDMGSLEPWQSRELYDLVKSIQPDCMVSGRLGNDVYDFAVMADNKFPGTALQAPWQSAASMFPETWSYRSWQERGRVEDKVAEKLRSLIEVVSHGGNYLLNIGPASDGSIVPFEKDVIRAVGKWLERNGDAVYGTSPSPFRDSFPWGTVTVKGKTAYLLLTGKYPEDGRISLPVRKRGGLVVKVTPDMYADPADVKVIAVPLDLSKVSSDVDRAVPSTEMLTWKNASAGYSYSCFDYYSNYRSTVSYGWTVDLRSPSDSLTLLYTADECGRKVNIMVDGEEMQVVLGDDVLKTAAALPVTDHSFGSLKGGVFDNYHSWDSLPSFVALRHGSQADVKTRPFSNYLMTAVADVPEGGLYVLDVTAGNGVEVVVDGAIMTKHLNPYRTVCRREHVLLELEAGKHDIYVRAFNRFEGELFCGVVSSDSPEIYNMKVAVTKKIGRGRHEITVSAADRASRHVDCGLHNLVIRVE